MPDSLTPTSSPANVKLLQRIIRLRSHFNLTLPENIRVIKKQILESNLSSKGTRINNPSLFANAGSVLSNYEGPVSMGELSRDLEVPLSTATRTMDWLVDNGYAKRLPDPKDRRIVRVKLTEKGKETYQVISIFMLRRFEEILSPLTSEERETITTLLNKVMDAFEKAT
ncbi:MAG: MarR family transcriptional regulator [Anaerolineales bacterium]|jgi:DNA-binding MarR family transcriptional regulator